MDSPLFFTNIVTVDTQQLRGPRCLQEQCSQSRSPASLTGLSRFLTVPVKHLMHHEKPHPNDKTLWAGLGERITVQMHISVCWWSYWHLIIIQSHQPGWPCVHRATPHTRLHQWGKLICANPCMANNWVSPASWWGQDNFHALAPEQMC